MLGYFSFAEGTIAALWGTVKAIVPQILTFAIALVIVFVAYKILTKAIYHALVRTIKGKPSAVKSDVNTLMQFWRYFFLFIALIVLAMTFSGGFAATGISIGLLSAALGWALQKPITGIAAWLMILIKKPFKVGDRIIIDGIKGDVSDITMFYIVLDEFGGTVTGEENSGRTILIPTSVLFDKPVVNYTLSDEYILDEIITEFTYESDLRKAEKIMVDAAQKFAGKFNSGKGSRAFTRVSLSPSGVLVTVRYHVPAKERQRVMSEITREVYNTVMKENGVSFAYPHTELVFGENALKVKGGK